MVTIEQSTIINRPIEEVFAYVSDQRNSPQWQDGVVDVQQSPESPVGVGTKVTLVRVFLGRRLEQHAEVVAYEPPTRYAFASTSGPSTTGTNRFEATAEGTKVTIAFEMQAGGLFSLAEPLVARNLRRSVEAALGNLKDLLESRAVEAPS
ncbi:MAG TPA: SRPBCC family protein [Ktedonobacterales bacterium]|jgi:uncharacterized membrane protein